MGFTKDNPFVDDKDCCNWPERARRAEAENERLRAMLTFVDWKENHCLSMMPCRKCPKQKECDEWLKMKRTELSMVVK